MDSSKRRHEVGPLDTRPLSEEVASLIAQVPRFGPYVWTTDGRSHYQAFNKAKSVLDRFIAHDDSVDIMRPEVKDEVLRATLRVIQEEDARTDAERVRAMIDDYRAGGLAAVGIHDVLAALSNGQADTVFLSSSFEQMHSGEEDLPSALVPELADTRGHEREGNRRRGNQSVSNGFRGAFHRRSEAVSERRRRGRIASLQALGDEGVVPARCFL